MSNSNGKISSQIPFHRPSIGQAEIEQVVACLRSGWLTSGSRVKEFEQRFAEYVGAPHAIAVNSCTAAMHIALAALDIKPGDEVITTPYTFVGTCEAIQYLGAKPVFVDVEPDTLNLNPDFIAAATTERTRALLPVHIAGHPADMGAIMQVARAHGLKVVEDAAHALESAISDSGFPVTAGSMVNGEPRPLLTEPGNGKPQNGALTLRSTPHTAHKIGTIGDMTCFSFYATKNLTTGEGGMITCSVGEQAERMRMLSLHGMSKDAWQRYGATGSWRYEIVEQGYKYNLTDMAAALGLAQLGRIDQMWQRRAAIAARFNAAFSEMEELEVPTVRPGIKHAWHLYILRLQLDHLTIDRDQFFEELRERGVCCSVHFIPLHLMSFYRQQYGSRQGDFPEAEQQFRRAISLPLYPELTEAEIERIIAAVMQVVARHSKKQVARGRKRLAKSQEHNSEHEAESRQSERV